MSPVEGAVQLDAGQQLPRQRVQLIDDASATARQVRSTFVEQRQDIGRAFEGDRSGVALQGDDACGGGRVDAVVLAPPAAGELPDPGGRGGRNVEDDLAGNQQPLRQMVPEPLGVLDRPLALRPGLGPREQLL